VAAPAAHAVEFEIGEDTTFSLGGTLEPVYRSVTDPSGESDSELGNNDSTLEFNGEHQWTERTTGFFHAEYEWDFDEEDGGIDDLDSAWIGMRGDLGMIRTGTSDTLYEDNVAELIDDFENGTLEEEEDGGEGNQIRYVTPDFGGFSAGIETRIEGDGEDNFDADAVDPDDSAVGVSIMARYDAANWGAVVGADDRGASYIDTDGDPGNEAFDDETTAGVGGYFEIAPVRLSARVASESNRGNDNGVEYAGLMGSYNYGPGSVHVGVQDVSPDQGNSRTELAAIITHGLYDNLDVFAAIARYDQQNDNGDLNEIGAIYSF